jgi:hypothetical protein
MKLFTYSTARQRLAEVLEEASREGEVQIRRQDGRVYAVTPVAKPARSPFANVTGAGRSGVRRPKICSGWHVRKDGHVAHVCCAAPVRVARRVAKPRGAPGERSGTGSRNRACRSAQHHLHIRAIVLSGVVSSPRLR